MSASPALDELERGLWTMLEGLKRLREQDDWVDQNTSPLKKRAFLEACRRGDLVGRKVGSQVLVRRSEVDAYIERHRMGVVPTLSEAEEEERAINAAMNFRARPPTRRKK
jgi:hypothetical protein